VQQESSSHFQKKLGTPQDPDGGLGVCCARPRDRSRQATEHRLSWFASISTANLLTSGPRRRRRKLPPKVDPSRVDSYAELSRIYADRAEWSSSKRFCSRFPSRSRMTWPVSQSGRATHGPELGSLLSRTIFPRLTSWLRSWRNEPPAAQAHWKHELGMPVHPGASLRFGILTHVRCWVAAVYWPPRGLVERRRGCQLYKIEHRLKGLLQLRDEDRHDVLGI
jgi:hypothetical protein